MIKQQPFFLRFDRLYISTELAKDITPFDSNSDKCTIKYNIRTYQKNIYFFKGIKQKWTGSSGHIYESYKSRQANTNISVRYRGSYGMSIIINRGNKQINEHGEFQYYIGGNSGDYEMHGKNMIRATRDCNLNLMIKLYPIIPHIKKFYKKLQSDTFLSIIKNEIINNHNLAEYAPMELEGDQDIGYLVSAIKYNL